jgi:tetratricopeptide (TPR) repeat protein
MTPLSRNLGCAVLGTLMLAGAPRPLPAAVFAPALMPADLQQIDPAVADAIRSQAQAINARPGDLESVGTLCLIYEANILWELARECFAAVSRESPDDLLWAYHLAIATRESGRVEESTAMLAKLAAKHPDFAPLQQRLGDALLQTGDLEGARAAFRRVIDLEPTAAEGYAGLGDVLLREQQYAPAIEVLENAVSRDANYRVAHYLLGMAYRGAGRRDDAARELVLGLDAQTRYLPDPLTARLGRYRVSSTARAEQAMALLGAGRPQEAAAVLEQALAYKPTDVTLLNNLAIAYLHQGQLEKAHQTLQRALQVDEAKFSTYLNLSSWALRSRQPELALEYADAAIARADNLYQTHLARARALVYLGRPNDAVESLQAAVRLNSRSPEPFAMLADQLVQLGHFDAAEKNYRDALSVAPDFFPSYLGLARIYLAQGRRDDAAAAVRQAADLAPGHPAVAAMNEQLESMQ